MTMTSANFGPVSTPLMMAKRRKFASGGMAGSDADPSNPFVGQSLTPQQQAALLAYLQSGGQGLGTQQPTNKIDDSAFTGQAYAAGDPRANNPGPAVSNAPSGATQQQIEPAGWTGLPFPKGDPRNTPVPATPLTQTGTQQPTFEQFQQALTDAGYTPLQQAGQTTTPAAVDPSRYQPVAYSGDITKYGQSGGEHMFFPQEGGQNTGSPLTQIDINKPYDDPSLHRNTNGGDPNGTSPLTTAIGIGTTGLGLYSLYNKLFPGTTTATGGQEPGNQTPPGDPDPNAGDGLTGAKSPIIPVTGTPLTQPNGNVDVQDQIKQEWDPNANGGQGGFKIPGAISGLTGAIPGAIDALSGTGKIPTVEVQDLAGGIGTDTLTGDAAKGIDAGGTAAGSDSFLTKLNSDPIGTLGNLGLDVAGGFAGNALGKAIGGDQSGGSIGGAIGSIAGNFIPVVGQIPFLGSFIGSTIGRLIGSFIGAHPTTGPISDSTITWGGDDKGNAFTLHDTKVDPGIRNAKNEQELVPKLNQVATGLGSSVQGTLTKIVDDIGGGVASMPNITIGTKFDKNSKSQKYYAGDSLQTGGKERLFDDPGQAIAYAVYTGLDKSKFGEGSDPNKLATYKTQLQSVFEPKPAAAPDASKMTPDQLASYAASQVPQHFAEGGQVDERGARIQKLLAMHRTPLMAAGKQVKGPGDGQSDNVPAMLSAGEFVIPSDVVATLGNGDNDAGAKRLDGMLANVRKHRAKGGAGLPPPSKTPLEMMGRSK
jgi:hypothetical protein